MLNLTQYLMRNYRTFKTKVYQMQECLLIPNSKVPRDKVREHQHLRVLMIPQLMQLQHQRGNEKILIIIIFYRV